MAVLVVGIGLYAVPASGVQAKIKTHFKLPAFDLSNFITADNTASAEQVPAEDAAPNSPANDAPVLASTSNTHTAAATDTVVTAPTPEPLPTPAPAVEPAFTPASEVITLPTPSPLPVVHTKATTKSNPKIKGATTTSTTATSSIPFEGTLGASVASAASIYSTSSHLPPDMTRLLLELSLVLGAAGLVLAQERGLRTTLSRVWD